jgi:hypothetical protein
MNFTDAELCKKYQELQNVVVAREAAVAEELAPYKSGMEVIKNEFLRRFQERGSTNSKTEFGTPYKSTIMNVKVVARDTFMKFCLDNWSTVGAEMMNVAAVKDPVKQFLDNGGTPEAIGIGVSFLERINMPKG